MISGLLFMHVQHIDFCTCLLAGNANRRLEAGNGNWSLARKGSGGRWEGGGGCYVPNPINIKIWFIKLTLHLIEESQCAPSAERELRSLFLALPRFSQLASFQRTRAGKRALGRHCPALLGSSSCTIKPLRLGAERLSDGCQRRSATKYPLVSQCCCNFCFPGSSPTAQGPDGIWKEQKIGGFPLPRQELAWGDRGQEMLEPEAEETTAGLLSLIPTHFASREGNAHPYGCSDSTLLSTAPRRPTVSTAQPPLYPAGRTQVSLWKPFAICIRVSCGWHRGNQQPLYSRRCRSDL